MFESMKIAMIALDIPKESREERQGCQAIKLFLAELIKTKQVFITKPTPKTERLSPEQHTVLEQLIESASRRLQESLQELCRQPVEVAALSPLEISGQELSGPILSAGGFTFSTTSESARARLIVDQKLALLLVDCLLGGTGEAIDSLRPLTALEMQILCDGVPALLSPLSQAWQKLEVFTPKLQGPARPAEETDWALALPFAIKLAGTSGELSYVLPQPACETLLAALRLSRWSAEQMAAKLEVQTDILRTLNEVNLPLRAVLGTTRVPLNQLAGMNVGDIICLETQESDDLLLYAGDKETLRAKMIALGGRLAAQVAETIRPGGQ